MLNTRYVYVKPDLYLVGCAAISQTAQPNNYTLLATGLGWAGLDYSGWKLATESWQLNKNLT